MNQFPKVDLHCHLDGSLDLQFLRSVSGIPDMEQVRNMVQVEGDECQNLGEYLAKFDLPLACLKKAEHICKAAETFVASLAADDIMYVEARFAPMSLISPGLSAEDVLRCVLRGLKKGEEQTGIRTNVILCAMRHHTPEQNLEVFRLALDYLGRGVCAVDLAGDEAGYPTSGFRGLFAYAKENGIPFTIHAGECGRAEDVAEAIAMGASRIGHGIAMRGNAELQKLCAEQHVCVELCPRSNFQTKAVPAPEDYPIREFLYNGVILTVNTDNRTVSNTSVTREFALLKQRFGFTDDELLQLTRNGIQYSFADDATKQILMRKIPTSPDSNIL